MPKSLFLLILMLISVAAFGAGMDTLIVLDMRNGPDLPKHFRTAHVLQNKNIDWTGFENLHIAGGAQFSKMSLKKILHALKTKKMTIIDLRQEAHGFLNGNAISWYAPHNAANKDLPPAEIEIIQAVLLDEINSMGDDSITVYKILKKTPSGNIEKTKEIEFAIHQTSSEVDAAEQFHLHYYRIYVQDFHGPGDKEVDRFIQIAKHLSKKKWIYFHCRAGVGRSTVFMMMYDMMLNAKKVSFENIFSRQVAIGGKDLSILPAPGTYKHKPAVERLNFLKKFYEYARNNDDQFETSWSQWLKKQRS